MAGQKQGSARVTLREIDESQVSSQELLPQGVPAAVVGTSQKGPAFVPQTFSRMQQFSEVFGSMTTRGRLNNSNLLGPLALNEWMRQAQSGTFLRVLGVGDGNSSETNAGFVVGSEQVQSDGKVGKNSSASITNTTVLRAKATKNAKTHMLGCFMKDVSGSTFLQDAGVQTTKAAGSIEVKFKNDFEPAFGDTFKITFLNDASNQSSTASQTFTFADEAIDNNGSNANIASGGRTANAKEVLTDLMNAINKLVATKDHLIASVSGTNTDPVLKITSLHPDHGANTNNITVEYKINASTPNDVEIGGKNASEASQTVSFGSAGNTAARFNVTMSDNPASGGLITFSLIANDGDATLSDKQVQYKFLSGLGDNNEGNDVVPNVYHIESAGVTEIKIGATPIETLQNFKAALDRVNTAGTNSNHKGLSTSSLDIANKKLTIFQKNLGQDGNSLKDDAQNITAFTATNTKLTVAATVGDALNSTTVDRSPGALGTAFFYGGTDSDEKKNLTIKLTGNPRVDDRLVIRTQEVNNVDGNRELHLLFDVANSTDNGATSGTARKVKIGVDLQETLYNLRNEIIDDQNKTGTSRVDLDVDVTVDDANDSLTLTYKNNNAANDTFAGEGNAQGGLRGDTTCEGIEMGEYATFSNTSGFSLVGNHGPKTVNFTGGGGAAVPVVRGVLMAPQGVKPSLEVSKSLDGNYVMTDENGLILTSEVNARVFGATKNTNLAGYSIGDVSSADQSFKVILNGFNAESGTGHKNTYTCSFDPQASNYFAKVLNTDPSKTEELGHYLYAHWDIEKGVATPSRSGLLRGGAENASYDTMTGFLISKPASEDSSSYEKFESRFKTAKTPMIVSQFYNSAGNKANRPSVSKDKTFDLFRLHVLDDGEIGNNLYRVLISDLRHEENDYGTFTLTLEKFDSDSITGTPVARWRMLNLDPDHRNFIGRVIGTRHTFYDFDAANDRQRLKTEGKYELKNKYVRVELSDAVKSKTIEVDALPTGFKGHGYLETANAFTEEAADSSSQLVFSNSSNNKIDQLASLKVAPLPYVTSISRKISSTTLEASSDLAWGVKFGIKKNSNESTNPKELGENEFNKSLLSWAKFYPTSLYKEGDTADLFENSFFSLEKILIPDSGVTSDSITSWDNASYKRDGVYTGSEDPNDADTVDDTRFVTISSDAKGKNVKYLKFRCMFQGGFDGVNIFDKEKAELTSIAAEREGRDETGTSKTTGPTVMSYRKAIDVLTDKSAAEFQLLVIPGQRSFSITDYAITACETRFDAMLIMDIEEKDANNSAIESSTALPHVGNTISSFENRLLNTSFAAAYFPNVLIRRTSDNAPVEVPPSVAMIGVMSNNDAIEAPWFAPAGLSRGTLINSTGSKVQMNRDVLDDLYDADINPIYEPAGRPGEVYAFGQKTLLQDASALDRINVRRLLINLRRKVKKVAEQLLFEPNRDATLQRFAGLVEPIMEDVKRRRGVVRYKVQIDTSTTTQNDIENNTIRGKIYLQPTKSVEFISLDFVVANTIQ